MSRPTFKAAVSALEDLQARAVASSVNPDDPSGSVHSPEWYAARALGVTASEIAKLTKGGGAARRELIAAKLAGGMGVDLSGNRYVRWGVVREPFIAEWINHQFGIQPNQTVFRGVNPRHLATPDGVGQDFDERLLISEIKTSKHDLSDGDGKTHYALTGYYDQKQWQLWVTGAEQCLFAWEQHDDDFSRWPEDGPRPLYPEPKYRWVERDEKRIAELVAVADEFLVELDAARESAGVAPELDVELDVLAQEVLAARVDEAAAKARKDKAWKQLQERLAGRGDLSQEAVARVTWSAPVTKTEYVANVDDVAALGARPELFKAYADARAEWEEHVEKFTTREPVQKVVPGKLTVTAVKAKADAEA